MAQNVYIEHPYVSMARRGFGAYRSVVFNENRSKTLELYSILPINFSSLPDPSRLWTAKTALIALERLMEYRNQLLDRRDIVHIRLAYGHKVLFLDVLPNRTQYDDDFMIAECKAPIAFLDSTPGRDLLSAFQKDEALEAHRALLPEATYLADPDEILQRILQRYPTYRPRNN